MSFPFRTGGETHEGDARAQSGERGHHRARPASSIGRVVDAVKALLAKPRDDHNSILVRVGENVVEYAPRAVFALGMTILGLMHENARVDAESLRLIQIIPTWLGGLDAPYDTFGALLERYPAISASLLAGTGALLEYPLRHELRKLRIGVQALAATDADVFDEKRKELHGLNDNHGDDV